MLLETPHVGAGCCWAGEDTLGADHLRWAATATVSSAAASRCPHRHQRSTHAGAMGATISTACSQLL